MNKISGEDKKTKKNKKIKKIKPLKKKNKFCVYFFKKKKFTKKMIRKCPQMLIKK
jgi:tRNA U38,U39,U40 pseudouridine synthase TruA